MAALPGILEPTALGLAKAWAPLLAGLSDPALLLDIAEGLIGHSPAARALLGAAVDVRGTPVRRVLGLPDGSPLEGPAELDPPASGLRARIRLLRTPLFDDSGALVGSLLVLGEAIVGVEPVVIEGLEGRLRDVALTISSALDIDLVLDRVVRFAIELTGATSGSLPIYDATFDRLLPSHVVGIDLPQLKAPVYRGTGAVWHLLDTGELFLHNAYRDDPRAIPWLVAHGVCAVAAAPLRAGDQILGSLNLYHTEPGRIFTPHDLALIDMLGRHAGVALQNARRYRAALREAARRKLLYQASLAFGSSLAPEELYAIIHRTLAQLMPCDTIAIALYDEPSGTIDYVYMADSRGRWPSERIPVERGLLGRVVRTGIALRLIGCDPEIEGWFGAEPFGEGEDATGSLVAVALTVGGRTIGAITVQAKAPDAYSTAALDDLETLAATAAIALQNAHLFKRVQELATTDPLTGAANRRHFFDLARLEIERTSRYGRPMSLLMLDADHFKQINDRYGHQVGDDVLCAIAARCRSSLREVDVLGRYGGEEFLILLPETGPLQAMQVAERLRALVGGEPVTTEAGPVAASISVGVASLMPDAPRTVEQLLDEVDSALYLAKAAGRNQARALWHFRP